MTVEYAEGYTIHRRSVKLRGPLQLAPGQNAEGYGNRITSDYVLKFTGEKREYRVYVTQWSNAGTFWVKRLGKTLVVRSFFRSEVKED